MDKKCLFLDKKPNIFICPLDWGIGHATRCVPVVQEFLRKDAEVTLGASGRSRSFLEKEFPELPILEFPGISISYPEKGERMPLHMLLRTPALLKGIRQEHHKLDEFIRKYDFDGVVSDNRYGLNTDSVPSVLITHQIYIKAPAHLKMLEPVLEKQTKSYIQRFDFCWIPDNVGEPNLSGDLSHKKLLPENYRYTGALSRFASFEDKTETANKGIKHYDILCLLSGPEPQRTLLEKKMLEKLRETNIKAAMVLGKPETEIISGYPDHIDVFPHLGTSALYKLLKQTNVVMARPGYSTIMDLAVTGNKAVLIPTPGQTEQEYLGNRFEEKKIFHSVRQDNLRLQETLAVATSYTGLKHPFSMDLLKKSVDEFLDLVVRNKKT